MFVNMYMVLRSLLRCMMIDSSYEDTTIFIFHVWVFGGYIISSDNQVSFFHLARLLGSGSPT